MSQMIFIGLMGIISIVLLAVGSYMILNPDTKVVKKIVNLDDKKSLSDLTYTEFTVYIYSNHVYPIISYDDFEIYYIDGRYYYYYTGFDKDEFYEVEEIAALDYSCTDDLLIPDSAILSTLFECDICGEIVTDDNIYYGWYKKVGDR
jgi:hypothetical protein